MGKNAYLLEKERKRQQTISDTESVIKQYMADLVEITLHEELGFGYDRIANFMTSLMSNFAEYRLCLAYKHDEVGYWRTCLDNHLKDIVGEHEFYEFSERYPELKEVWI